MNVSARNVFKGQVTGLTGGAVNAKVEVTTAGGDKIVAIVTEGSVMSLALVLGQNAIAFLQGALGHGAERRR